MMLGDWCSTRRPGARQLASWSIELPVAVSDEIMLGVVGISYAWNHDDPDPVLTSPHAIPAATRTCSPMLSSSTGC